MSKAVILSAVRTPVGRYGGALSGVRPDDLAALVVREAVERAGVPAEQIEDVWLGCANQAGEDNRNVARMAVLLAGLPESIGGVTVNRLCASGLAAIVGACHAVIARDGDLFVAGGVDRCRVRRSSPRITILGGYIFTLNPAKTVKSIALPSNGNLIILAMQLATDVTPVSLSAYYNRAGIYTDGTTYTNPATGGLDGSAGGNNSYSGSLLGSWQIWTNTIFDFGTLNATNVIFSTNQIVSLPQGNYSHLRMLAAGSRRQSSLAESDCHLHRREHDNLHAKLQRLDDAAKLFGRSQSRSHEPSQRQRRWNRLGLVLFVWLRLCP